jgi:predicted anti-sigma-YlaC factor YlaD
MHPRAPFLRLSSAATFLCCTSLAGCASVSHLAVNKLGDALSGSGSGFAADDDPELIRAAAPFSLKLMESLLAQSPRHAGLLTAASSGFTQYAYAFVQEDADELESRDVGAAFAARERARGLYHRGRDYGLRALEVRHPGFGAALRANPGAAAAQLGPQDVTATYWTAVSWAAWISLSKDSADALADLRPVDALVERLKGLDPDFNQGALDSFLMRYEIGRPGRRDSLPEVQRHFERAVKLSGGQRAAPYVTFAEAVCVRAQDRKQFESKLHEALAIDAAAQPASRLENLVMQRRARWLLGQAEQLFLQ